MNQPPQSREVDIIKEKPPIWDAVVASGMNPNEHTTLFSYGIDDLGRAVIYNPGGQFIPPDLIEHERTHCARQGTNPDPWWERYVNDQYFRIEEEVIAYAAQLRFIAEYRKDRNYRFVVLNRMATQLSSPTYGSVITQADAMQMIKKAAHI